MPKSVLAQSITYLDFKDWLIRFENNTNLKEQNKKSFLKEKFLN